MARSKSKESLYKLARRIADRLEGLGHAAFASENSRYATLDDGEIVEMGRPLSGSRIFPTKALARNIAILRELKTYIRGRKECDWLWWEIKTTGHKTAADELAKDLEEFNSRINVHFSELRKKHQFEVLLIVIHVRYDDASGLFDLHAHFICRMPEKEREAAKCRLMTAFSKVDLPDDPIRNMAAATTYALWGVFRAREMQNWPDEALTAVWKLSRLRPRLVRPCGGFRRWRKKQKAEAEAKAKGSQRLPRLQAQRSDEQPARDRLLTRAKIRIRGQKRWASIFEKRGKSKYNPVDQQPSDYSTTACATVQEPSPDAALSTASAPATARTGSSALSGATNSAVPGAENGPTSGVGWPPSVAPVALRVSSSLGWRAVLRIGYVAVRRPFRAVVAKARKILSSWWHWHPPP